PNNQLGQFNGVTTTTFALPNTGTTGGLAFVPSGYPNAGTLLVSTYGAGVIYEITLQTLANGFKQPIAASVWCDLSTVGRYYLEGMRFIPSGPHAGDLLVCDYNGPVLRLDVDANGLPAGGALNPSVEETAVFGNTEGLAFDPVTKDLLVSIFTFAELHQIAGYDSFQALTVEPSSFVSTATESATRLQIRAGSINYLRSYILAASASGTVPGTPVGSVVVPLNIDFLTLTVLQYANTPLFDGVVGTTGLFGEATATINLPALNVVGPVATDWAFLLLSPEDFASNPAPIILTP
ncbi:MAG TPA: hypothetical protein VEI02_00380, partial [Planctomycetota bacterium]|nr:hypothetical protein [Planctomycetota bacterium]